MEPGEVSELPEPHVPAELVIEPATSPDDARRALELIREHGWSDLRREE